VRGRWRLQSRLALWATCAYRVENGARATAIESVQCALPRARQSACRHEVYGGATWRATAWRATAQRVWTRKGACSSQSHARAWTLHRGACCSHPQKRCHIPPSACLVARRVRVQPSKLAALLCTLMRCAALRAGWRRPWLKKREWRLAGRRARASPMAPIDLQCWSTQRVHAWRPAGATWAQGWTCQAQRHARQGQAVRPPR